MGLESPSKQGGRPMSQTTRNAHVMASVAVALALGANRLSAQQRPAATGITIYDDVTFQGGSLTLLSAVPALRDFNLNDRISSLQVAPGEAWEICEDANSSGRCMVIS